MYLQKLSHALSLLISYSFIDQLKIKQRHHSDFFQSLTFRNSWLQIGWKMSNAIYDQQSGATTTRVKKKPKKQSKAKQKPTSRHWAWLLSKSHLFFFFTVGNPRSSQEAGLQSQLHPQSWLFETHFCKWSCQYSMQSFVNQGQYLLFQRHVMAALLKKVKWKFDSIRFTVC